MRHCAVQMHLSLSLSLSLFLSLFLCSSDHSPVYGHLPIQKLPASHKLRVTNCESETVGDESETTASRASLLFIVLSMSM